MSQARHRTPHRTDRRILGDRRILEHRRIPTIIASVLAVLGVLLITLAACSSRPGPPQPTAAAAGSIGGTGAVTAGSTAPVSTTMPGPPTPTPPATAKSSSTAKAGASARGGSTTSKSASIAPKTTHVVVPSFTSSVKGPVLQASPPVSIAIPAIKVTSKLLDLGLNSDGTVQVPSLDDPDSKAGWYQNSPEPGSVGPAIILGHIDSKKYGPGVFYELGNLKPGDEVDITRQDGSVAVFRIDGVRSYPKNDFPTKDVYGNIDHAGLRLITCGGTFDPSIGSYESNIVAYGSLVSSRQS